jgi:hypothetical protein
MSKADANAYREGRVKDDSLRVLNLCFVIAVILAGIIVIYAYASTGQWTLPSDLQTSPSPEGLKVQDGTPPYEAISSKIKEFVEWGMSLINSLRI